MCYFVGSLQKFKTFKTFRNKTNCSSFSRKNIENEMLYHDRCCNEIKSFYMINYQKYVKTN